MFGPAKPRRLDEPITVSLEALVPTDHFYCHLEAKPDLSVTRASALLHYASGPAEHRPGRLLQTVPDHVLRGFRTERQLIEAACFNLAHR